jgi:DNA-binding MarR family transcriptional regulator
MDNSFHYLLLASNTMFHKNVMACLLKEGLTPGQPKVLDFLSRHNGCMQNEISAGVFTDKSTLTGILTKMEEKGLIVRKQGEKDRRAMRIYLTDLGTEKLEIVKRVFEEKESEAFKNLSLEEQTAFVETFLKICKNLGNEEELQ